MNPELTVVTYRDVLTKVSPETQASVTELCTELAGELQEDFEGMDKELSHLVASEAILMAAIQMYTATRKSTK